MKIWHCSIGELDPDPASSGIQLGLTLKHKVPVYWSHSGWLVEDAGEDSGFYDSTDRGFAKCTLDEALDHGKAVIRHKVRVRVRDDREFIEWLKRFIGTPYSHLGFFRHLPKFLRVVLSYIIPYAIMKIFVNGRAASYCSESTAWAMRDNCIGGLWDPELSEDACDQVDPYMAWKIALKYQISE